MQWLRAIIRDTRIICFTKDIHVRRFARSDSSPLSISLHALQLLLWPVELVLCRSQALRASLPQKRQVLRHRAAMSRGLGCLHATWMACRSTIAAPLRATSVLGQQTRLCASSPEELEHKKVCPILGGDMGSQNAGATVAPWFSGKRTCGWHVRLAVGAQLCSLANATTSCLGSASQYSSCPLLHLTGWGRACAGDRASVRRAMS